MYVCMNRNVCVYIYTCMHVYIWTGRVYKHCENTCVHPALFIHVHVICMSMRVCSFHMYILCIYVYMYMHIHVYTHTYIHI